MQLSGANDDVDRYYAASLSLNDEVQQAQCEWKQLSTKVDMGGSPNASDCAGEAIQAIVEALPSDIANQYSQQVLQLTEILRVLVCATQGHATRPVDEAAPKQK